MFFVIIYSAIDQGYIGLSLASCQKDEIWAELELIWDLAWHLATRMKFGTCEQNWDLHGTISGLWSQLGPSLKFGTSLRALHSIFIR